MAATTIAAIQARISTVIRELVPTMDEKLRFIPSLNQGAAAFRADCEQNPQSATRRFQARKVARRRPDVSNSDVELWWVTFEIVVAYAQSHHFGDGAAIDRDKAMDEDFHKIFFAIALNGRANFTPPTYPDACWVDEASDIEPTFEAGRGCDFLVMRQTYQYYRAVS